MTTSLRAMVLMLALPVCVLLIEPGAGAYRGEAIHVIGSPHPYRWGNVVIGGGGWMTCLVPHPRIPDLLWLGSDMSGPWKRAPGDQRWRSEAWSRWTPPNVSGVLGLAVDPLDGLTVYVERGDTGGSMGPPTEQMQGLYVTRDGGVKVPDYDSFSPFSIQAAPGRAGEVWAAMSGYGIRRTRDFGQTWEDLKGVVAIGANPAKDPFSGRPCLVGFGAPAPGRPANEPTIYVFVQLAGDQMHSLLRSSDIAMNKLTDFTWERVQKWEFGGLRPTLLQGSRQKFGQVFMGVAEGVIYGEPAP